MNTKILGNAGESIACVFLRNKGFTIIVRNYSKPWGEIDIIAKKTNKIHFFEVKSVIVADLSSDPTVHRPEDNVHGLKIKHIRRMIETYFDDKGIPSDIEFYFHVLCVYIDSKTRRARVKWIKNIIL
jgi:putative endonuclease